MTRRGEETNMVLRERTKQEEKWANLWSALWDQLRVLFQWQRHRSRCVESVNCKINFETASWAVGPKDLAYGWKDNFIIICITYKNVCLFICVYRELYETMEEASVDWANWRRGGRDVEMGGRDSSQQQVCSVFKHQATTFHYDEKMWHFFCNMF